MLKQIALLALPLFLLAAPALAQDDVPALEIGLGYGNYGITDLDPEEGIVTNRLHGFAMQTNINFNDWFGVDNYTGVYSVGNSITLFTNIIGVKITARDIIGGRFSPYVLAGLGGGSFSNSIGGSVGVFGTRYGGGIDWNWTEAVAVRVDLSRMALSNGVVPALGIVTDQWKTATNVATTLVFKLGN